jgi:hypothetical protein
MAWGPPGPTVTIQYSRDSVRVFAAHFHGSIPVLLLLMAREPPKVCVSLTTITNNQKGLYRIRPGCSERDSQEDETKARREESSRNKAESS